MGRTAPNSVRHYGQIYEYIDPGSLLGDNLPHSFERAWKSASPEGFSHNAHDEGASERRLSKVLPPRAAE